MVRASTRACKHAECSFVTHVRFTPHIRFLGSLEWREALEPPVSRLDYTRARDTHNWGWSSGRSQGRRKQPALRRTPRPPPSTCLHFRARKGHFFHPRVSRRARLDSLRLELLVVRVYAWFRLGLFRFRSRFIASFSFCCVGHDCEG